MNDIGSNLVQVVELLYGKVISETNQNDPEGQLLSAQNVCTILKFFSERTMLLWKTI